MLAGLKGEGSGGHSVTAEKGSAGSDCKSLRSSPFLTFVPEIYPLSHKPPLGVQDRILQIFVPHEETASRFLGPG